MGESTFESGRHECGKQAITGYAMNISRQLYEDMILDHNRAPRNFMRIPPEPLCNAHGFNPICGDDFNIYLQVENNIIKDASFDGAGCAISTASASLMTDAVKGMSVSDAREPLVVCASSPSASSVQHWPGIP